MLYTNCFHHMIIIYLKEIYPVLNGFSVVGNTFFQPIGRICAHHVFQPARRYCCRMGIQTLCEYINSIDIFLSLSFIIICVNSFLYESIIVRISDSLFIVNLFAYMHQRCKSIHIESNLHNKQALSHSRANKQTKQRLIKVRSKASQVRTHNCFCFVYFIAAACDSLRPNVII